MSSESSDRRPFLGARMRHGWQWIWQQIVAGVAAAGYDDVTAAHIGMFRHPTLDGQRPTQLADQLQITKQSVNDLLGHLEHAGYITRQPDPADRRARIIRLTAKGKRLEQTIRDQAQAADQQIAELLGTQRYAQLCIALEELSDRLATNPMSNRRR
jgi:DNA-binding MarR family transcriptional regulator